MTMDQSAQVDSNGTINAGDITMGSVGIRLPVTSGIDPTTNAVNTTVTGTIAASNCSTIDGSTQQQAQQQQQQQQQIQIPGGTMSIGSLAVAMGLSGANTDPNSLTFTSNALATLSARMGMTSMAGGVGVTNAAGLMAANPGNSLVTFPGGNAASTLNLVPGVSMNIAAAAAAAGAGVSIIDGGALSMNVAGNAGTGSSGGLVMPGGGGPTPAGISVVGVPASGDVVQHGIGNTVNAAAGCAGGALLHNNLHINNSSQLVNNMGGNAGGGHSAGGCCGGCRTRVTVKDQSSQTDLSTVIQVKTEERLARSGLMPGARLISHSPGGTTISHANPNSHHGPNFPCSCDFCGRMFAKKEYLRRHVRIHTGERPYKCVICGHSFRRSHHLRCHELTHTGTKPYTCGICGKAFNLSHHLRRHEMTHTGEKPYACTECGKAFTRKQHLDRHYKTHTGEYHRTFKCPFCEKMFFRAHHRDKHMKRHVLTTPDLTAATFSPVNNMSLSIRSDGTLRAEGINSSSISVGSKDDSHSSDDYLTSDEEGKVPNTSKPKEGSKKRKGSSPIRLRFPYDYNATKTEIGGSTSGVMLHGLKNMTFPIPTGVNASGVNTILTTPTRGRPKGSKNKNPSTRGKKKAERAQRAQIMTQLAAMEMKTEQQDVDGRDAYGGIKKDEDTRGGVLFGAPGKTIANVPSSQFESVVVRHPLDSNSKGVNKEAGSTPVPTPTPPIHDGNRSSAGGAPQQLQWQGQATAHQHQQTQQQQVINAGNTAAGNDAYMSNQNLGRQLHTPGPNASNNTSASEQQQQTMHYKPATTPDNQGLHAWPVPAVVGGNWPQRIALSASDLTGRSGGGAGSGGAGVQTSLNSYNQVDASHFFYNASKVMEMRMADLRGQPHQAFDGSGGQWNQNRRDPNQEKSDNRIYTMHQ